jgi:hypothetical protein
MGHGKKRLTAAPGRCDAVRSGRGDDIARDALPGQVFAKQCGNVWAEGWMPIREKEKQSRVHRDPFVRSGYKMIL